MMTPEEKVPPNESVDFYVREFFQYTTIHGFSRFSSACGVKWHIFWILMLLGAHGAFYYHTYLLIDDYLARPIRTRATMKHGAHSVFPTVTICNRNALRKSKLPADFLEEIEAITTTGPAKSNSKNTTRKTSGRKAIPDPKLKHDFQVERELLRDLYNKHKIRVLREYGHQLEDMVLDCSFNGEDCTPKGANGPPDEAYTWRHIWLDEVGNCYMFNRALDDDGRNIEPYISTLPGDSSGLRLILNTEQYEYLDDISPYAGLRVVVATQGNMPFPNSHGIDVAPGFATSIELRKNQISRLDPFSNNSCEKADHLDTQNVFWLYNLTYSQMACKRSCLITMENNKCRCSQYHLPTVDNLEFCDFQNTTVTDCLEKVNNLFYDGSCDSRCPPPCSEIYFSTTISSNKWPSNSYKERLSRLLKREHNLTLTGQNISDNLIELHVYYADLDFFHVEETLKFKFQDLVSNVGGQLGMWIGVSAVSIAELIELYILLTNFLFNKRKKQSVVNVQRINVR